MDYSKTYEKIITSSRELEGIINKNYYEMHHIIPKCLGGSDDSSNIVKLTAKAHFVCHHLLCKIHPKNYKLASAFNLMCCNPHTNKEKYRYYNSRLYNIAKENFSRNNPMKDPDVVDRCVKTRKYNESMIPNHVRRMGEAGLQRYKLDIFEKNRKKWIKYHSENNNLHIEGYPLCKNCGVLMFKPTNRRGEVKCSYSCSNYYRYNIPKIDDSIKSDLLNKALRYYQSLNVDDIFEITSNNDKKTDLKNQKKFINMSDEEFEKFIENKAYTTRKRYSRVRKTALSAAYPSD